MIKVKHSATLYLEIEEKITLSINGKGIEVIKYQKQDPQFSDYELEINFDKEDLTEEEIDEVNDYFHNEL